MKEITKTITREFDNEGRLLKETEITVEKEYKDNIITYPYYPLYPYSPTYVDKITTPYKYEITCKTGGSDVNC